MRPSSFTRNLVFLTILMLINEVYALAALQPQISHSSMHYLISNIQYIWTKFKSSCSRVAVSRCQYLLWCAPSADYISQIRTFQARPSNAMIAITRYTWTASQNSSLIQICSCLVMRQAKMRGRLTDTGAGLGEAHNVFRGNVSCRARGFQSSLSLYSTVSSHMILLKVRWQLKNLSIFCASLWYLANSTFLVFLHLIWSLDSPHQSLPRSLQCSYSQ